MVSAFVLINVKVGHERDILEQVKKIPYVQKSDRVYGVYDMVIKIEADNLETLEAIVTKKIRTIKFIERTFTMIIQKVNSNLDFS